MLELIQNWLGEDWGAKLAYLSNGKHMAWYASLRYTLGAGLAGAALALVFGMLGAMMRRSRIHLLRGIGTLYTTMVRGIPDVLFFLFFPLAFEQLVELVVAYTSCTPDQRVPGQWPPCDAAQWYLSTTDYFIMACVSLGIVYGAFTANVIHGAMNAVPKGQLEAAQAYGLTHKQVFWRIQVRQMWVYALPGLSNVWMLLLKATSLLSLLQIADIVLWAERLGAPNYFPRVGLVHPDWRWKYYLALFIFYILLAMLSEWVFRKLQNRAGRGMMPGA